MQVAIHGGTRVTLSDNSSRQFTSYSDGTTGCASLDTHTLSPVGTSEAHKRSFDTACSINNAMTTDVNSKRFESFTTTDGTTDTYHNTDKRIKPRQPELDT